ncbi:apiosidase-like domain-containing protein [Pseudozobellia thermophila]|uniref:Putative collagen-binding domain of a collagenase n=1 Tax=Pseudozobellia thermophila TaxID=192903 RepID=A0A1M6CCW8_9FLAO|nr:DUF4038 domain-containing protein [Pseudozobellia thermophila]SHI58859.1 Putative collagen-binding domain of a collagenase [Pseudozobellia thermophila]
MKLGYAFMVWGASLALSFAQPSWEKHGRLEVSDNGHFIQHKDKTPFLWIGDTGWGMIQQLTREEVDRYLDNRKELGFTVIQTVVHWSPHGGGLKRSPDNAANAYGHHPFTGDEESPNTAEPLTVRGGGPQSPNDYWDHVDYVIEAAKKRHLYLALLPCWASQLVTGTGEYNEDEAKAFGAFLGKRYADEPHIIWVLGGDTKAQFKGYDKNQKYSEYDHREVYRAMAEGIGNGVTGKKLKWNESHPAWDEVFLTYHPNGDYPYGSSQWFHKDVWLDANGIEVWKEVDDVYRTVLDDYQLVDPVKPTLFLEGSYEYGSYRHECGWITPLRVRRQAYQTFFAGGAGHTYGAGPIWAMRGDEGDYNCGYTWQQALDFPGAMQVATVARKFLIDQKWHEWMPNGNVLSGTGLGDGLKTAVTTHSGDRALIYFSNNSFARVNNVFGREANSFWFDPRNGEMVENGPFRANESKIVAPPGKWEDAVLVLKIDNR